MKCPGKKVSSLQKILKKDEQLLPLRAKSRIVVLGNHETRDWSTTDPIALHIGMLVFNKPWLFFQIIALNRTLILWATGTASNSVDVRIHFTQRFKHNFSSELFPIVCMEYLRIANDPKNFLQLVRNEVT